jgi:hypothetical protein
LSRLVQRRIRQLKSVYEQARDVDVLLEFLQAENRAYVRGMHAQRQASALNQDLERVGDRVYVHAPPAFCQRRASYLKSLCEGVLERPIEVSILPPAWSSQGACRIALRLPVADPVR